MGLYMCSCIVGVTMSPVVGVSVCSYSECVFVHVVGVSVFM